MRKNRIGHSKRGISLGTAIALMIAAPVLGVTLGANAAHAQADQEISVDYAPPPLPNYDQPPLPGPDYIWVPGTWAWSDDIQDYYWVQGYWDLPPEPGLMWTPAWWGWDDYAYQFHQGYWGYEVGWYGGIDYGYGYHGHGWDGGRWDHGHVAYNRAVINVNNVRVNNVYYAPVTINRGPRASYNGGAGGVTARPRPEDMRAMNAQRFAPTPSQQQHTRQAASNPGAAASRITPAWNPSAVHRVGNDGTPIPRAAARGGAGAPAQNQAQYQQQRSYPNAPAGPAPRAYQPAPGAYQGRGQVPMYNGQPPRQTPQQPAPNYNRAPPQPNAQQHAQPAPNYGHAAPPQQQVHAAPPPRPAPPPHPAPPPRPQPPHNDHP